MADYKFKKVLQRFFDQSNHLDENSSDDKSLAENRSTSKPTMRVAYKDGNEIIDQAKLDAFFALSDHLD
jgi:hypothetical protein